MQSSLYFLPFFSCNAEANAFGRCFYPKRLTVGSAFTFTSLPWEFEPMTLPAEPVLVELEILHVNTC